MVKPKVSLYGSLVRGVLFVIAPLEYTLSSHQRSNVCIFPLTNALYSFLQVQFSTSSSRHLFSILIPTHCTYLHPATSNMADTADTDHPERPFPFLELPFEIRDMIYGKLLPRQIEGYGTRSFNEPIAPALALATTSHQVRDEVLSKLSA